jgi:hypothetical protein
VLPAGSQQASQRVNASRSRCLLRVSREVVNTLLLLSADEPGQPLHTTRLCNHVCLCVCLCASLAVCVCLRVVKGLKLSKDELGQELLPEVRAAV